MKPVCALAGLTWTALLLASPSFAQVEQSAEVGRAERSMEPSWTLRESDRVFLIAQQADTMAPLSFRVGTVDQLQTVQSLGAGYYADVFADFAPTSWLQVGLTVNYGTIGDPAVQNILAPTAYVKAQFLRQDSAGVNMAVAVNAKKIGFGHVTDVHPNNGELEAQVLVDRRIGKFLISANGVFGKSFSVPDSDVELKLSGGYALLPNLVVGLDTITRYDTSFDGGPQDGTRYWEFTGGGMVSYKISNFIVSGLVGVAAPFHNSGPRLPGLGIGPTGMLQVAYAL